jgi:hypothetical protein
MTKKTNSRGASTVTDRLPQGEPESPPPMEATPSLPIRKAIHSSVAGVGPDVQSPEKEERHAKGVWALVSLIDDLPQDARLTLLRRVR